MSEELEKKRLFKVSGVGLDTTTIKFKPLDRETVYNYIYTSISANNDYIIADYVKYMTGSVLIVGVDSLDGIDLLLNSHLKTLGRGSIDLLLIDASCDWEKYFDASKLKSAGVKEIGIKNPESAEQIEKINQVVQKKIEFVSLDLSPLCFNYDLVTWCENNSVQLLTFNPLGGFISSNAMINAFSVPYLLSFAGTYSSVIFLSGRDLFYSGESKKYIEGLYGKEAKTIFTLKKNVSRLYKPIKKVVNTALEFDESVVLNYDSPELLYDYDEILFSLGKAKEDKISVDDKELVDIENEVKNLLSISLIPRDVNSDGLFAIYRYQIINYLKVKYLGALGWKLEFVRLGDRMMAIKAKKEDEKKGWFKKKKKEAQESDNYFFALINDKPVFLKVKNSSEKA